MKAVPFEGNDAFLNVFRLCGGGRLFVGDGLARPVTINKSQIVRRWAVVSDAQCAPLLFECLFVGATALACSVVRN